MKWLRPLTLAGIALVLIQWTAAQDAKKNDPIPETVSYYKDVRPIIQQHCQGCHQPALAKGGYVMTDYAELFARTENNVVGVIPGKPAQSELYQQIISKKGAKPAMPRGKDPLSGREVKIIEKWITQGAKDDTPASAKLPAVDANHPPVYEQPPVINGLAFSKDGELLAVTGYHEVLLHKADGTELVARLIGA